MKIWRKGIILSGLYVGLAVGLPALVVLGIAQSYPVFRDPPPLTSGWLVKTQRLVFEPDGQMLLPPSTAFVVSKGRITLLTYPRLDQSGLVSQLYTEGESFGTWSGRRYAVVNREKGPVELVMSQVFAPNQATRPTATPTSSFSRGFTMEFINQIYIPEMPANDDLEQYVIGQRDRLLNKN